MKKYTILLIIGIVIFVLGGYQNIQYEDHSLVVAATITDIKTVDNSDGPTSYSHTYYGDYSVEGINYTHKKLKTSHTGYSYPDLSRGDIIEIIVDPDNPGKRVTDGGLFVMGGLGLIVYSTVVLIKKHKDK